MADLAWRCRSTAYVARATRAVQQLAHASARLMTSFDAGSGGSAEVMGPDPDQEVERERAYRECREVGVPPPLEQAKSSKSINVPSVSSRICHTRTRYARKNPLIPSRGLGGESSKKNRLRNPPPPIQGIISAPAAMKDCNGAVQQRCSAHRSCPLKTDGVTAPSHSPASSERPDTICGALLLLLLLGPSW